MRFGFIGSVISPSRQLGIWSGEIAMFTDDPTTPTTAASDIEIFLQDLVLQTFNKQLIGDVAAQKGATAQRKGDTIEWTRVLELARSTSALSGSTQPDTEALYTMDVRAQAEEYGGRLSIERIVELTAKNVHLLEIGAKRLSHKAAKSADYLIMTMLAANAFRIRADGDSTYQVDATATSDGVTTTFISSTLTQNDDHFNGGYLTVTGDDTAHAAREALYETKLISDFVASTDTVTTAAFSASLVTGVTAHLCVGTGLTASDKLTTDVFANGVARLNDNDGMRFEGEAGQNLPPKGSGYYPVYLDTHLIRDLIRDTTWVHVGEYQAKEQLQQGAPGVKWMGTKIYGTTQPWRETVAGATAEDTGPVHMAHFLGQEAYGISHISADGAKPPYGIYTRYNTSKDLGQTVPRNDELGYIMYFANASLNSMWNVCAICGATAF